VRGRQGKGHRKDKGAGGGGPLLAGKCISRGRLLQRREPQLAQYFEFSCQLCRPFTAMFRTPVCRSEMWCSPAVAVGSIDLRLRSSTADVGRALADAPASEGVLYTRCDKARLMNLSAVSQPARENEPVRGAAR